jgi:hypothetical protein
LVVAAVGGVVAGPPGLVVPLGRAEAEGLDEPEGLDEAPDVDESEVLEPSPVVVSLRARSSAATVPTLLDAVTKYLPPTKATKVARVLTTARYARRIRHLPLVLISFNAITRHPADPGTLPRSIRPPLTTACTGSKGFTNANVIRCLQFVTVIL